jgi:hypothetical protein
MYVGHVGLMKEVQRYINTRRYDAFRLSVQSEFNIEYIIISVFSVPPWHI